MLTRQAYLILFFSTVTLNSPLLANRSSNDVFKHVVRCATRLGTVTGKQPIIHPINRAELKCFCAVQGSCQFPKQQFSVHFPSDDRFGQCLCIRRTEYDTEDTIHLLRLIKK